MNSYLPHGPTSSEVCRILKGTEGHRFKACPDRDFRGDTDHYCP